MYLVHSSAVLQTNQFSLIFVHVLNVVHHLLIMGNPRSVTRGLARLQGNIIWYAIVHCSGNHCKSNRAQTVIAEVACQEPFTSLLKNDGHNCRNSSTQQTSTNHILGEKQAEHTLLSHPTLIRPFTSSSFSLAPWPVSVVRWKSSSRPARGTSIKEKKKPTSASTVLCLKN